MAVAEAGGGCGCSDGGVMGVGAVIGAATGVGTVGRAKMRRVERKVERRCEESAEVLLHLAHDLAEDRVFVDGDELLELDVARDAVLHNNERDSRV